MHKHSLSFPFVLGAAAVAAGVGSAAASPIFTFLSSDRYIEAWADGPYMEPPQHAHERVDAIGFEDFFADLHVRVEDDYEQSVEARVSQDSVLFDQGLHMISGGSGESAPPAGSSEGSSHFHFAVQFMVDRDIDVPLFLRVVGGESHDARFDFAGEGVDIHLVAWDDPAVFYDGTVSLFANEVYTMSLDGWSGSWDERASVNGTLEFWVPAPSTAAVLAAMLPLGARRRRC